MTKTIFLMPETRLDLIKWVCKALIPIMLAIGCAVYFGLK